jgi:hypothetical protein
MEKIPNFKGAAGDFAVVSGRRRRWRNAATGPVFLNFGHWDLGFFWDLGFRDLEF